MKDDIVTYDIAGQDVSGQCTYYPGGSYDGLHYSGIELNDADKFSSSEPDPTVSRNSWLLQFRDVTTTRSGQSVTMQALNVRATRMLYMRQCLTVCVSRTVPADQRVVAVLDSCTADD